MYSIIVDTNVLVDYYLGREPGSTALARMLELCLGTHALHVSPLSLKDVYYLVGTILKRQARQDHGTLSEPNARACGDIAWSCVQHATKTFIVTSIGATECLDAFVCRSLHEDFEDDLVLAAARSIRADFLVTSDEKLIQHSPVAALTPAAMTSLLSSEQASR